MHGVLGDDALGLVADEAALAVTARLQTLVHRAAVYFVFGPEHFPAVAQALYLQLEGLWYDMTVNPSRLSPATARASLWAFLDAALCAGRR